jgi:hypothetical protein
MAMNLVVTPNTQGVGGTQVFQITGGPPGAALAWSSTLNGVPTGEDHSMYAGQNLDSNGSWSAAIQWPAVLNGKSTIGEWEKIVYAYPPDMSAPWSQKVDFAIVQGQQSAPGSLPYPSQVGTIPGGTGATPTPSPTSTPAASGSSFLSGSITIGGVSIPNVALLAGGALLLLATMGGGGGRR